ncbi:MAG: hypothetical protein J7L20_05030 [Thermoplasmata archaeon]|nr:hypothetical protein [Thermoplasmata archaeon]
MEEESTLTSIIQSEINLLKRHIKVLKAVVEKEPVGIIRLSEITGYPQHMVRYSLHVLEQEGVIEPSPRGAVTTRKLKSVIESLKKVLSDIDIEINDLIKELNELPR